LAAGKTAYTPPRVWSAIEAILKKWGMPQDVIILFRPVGQAELDLIRAAGFREFPPRLPAQPIFYPVANEDYAVQIARDWNTKDAVSGFVGYVLRFSVRTEFLSRYEIHTVGDSHHREYSGCGPSHLQRQHRRGDRSRLEVSGEGKLSGRNALTKRPLFYS
jgi:hypothetical protein